MSTEWDDLVKSLFVSLDLNEARDKRDLYHQSMVGELLAIAKGGLQPSEKNISDLEKLLDDTDEFDRLTECTECGWEGNPQDKRDHDCDVSSSESEEEDTYDPDTTVVSGIVCKSCGKELPPMTMTEHLNGRGCPCEKSQLKKCKCGLYQTCDICKKYQERSDEEAEAEKKVNLTQGA